MNDDDRRDAQLRMLEQLGDLLSTQMAELAVGQQQAVRQRSEFADRITRIETSLTDTRAVTHEVRDLLSAVKGGFRVLGWLGVAAKWAGAIAAACVSIYTVIYMFTHGGNLPHGPQK
jgi:hypothetical protein